jgi:hypothetical protein
MSIDDAVQWSFKNNVAWWRIHCESVKHISNPAVYDDCEGYRSIVRMGEAILPLIRTEYASDDDRAFFSPFGWARAIHDITGKDIDVPYEERGHIRKIRDHYIAFLDSRLP